MLQPDRFQTTRANGDSSARIDYTNCACCDSSNSDPYAEHFCGDPECPVTMHRLFIHPGSGPETRDRMLEIYRRNTESVCVTNWDGQVAA